MLVIKCIAKLRDSKGRITHYKIQDTKGNTKIVTANQLKVAIANTQVNCVNLTLTSDNRLIDKEFKHKINKEELDREKIRHKKFITKISLLGNKLGDTTYRLNNAIYEIVDNKIYLKEVLIKNGEFEIPEFVSGFCKEDTEDINSDMQIGSTVFRDCISIKLKNKSNITDMSYLFSECTSIRSIDLTEFDTSKVTNMSGMFFDCSGLTSLDISNLDTSKVTDMSSMFYGCTKLISLNISGIDTSKVTDMHEMFHFCEMLKSLNLPNFDTSKVTNMQSMFKGCSDLEVLNLSNFDTSNVTDMNFMFFDCCNLVELDVSSFDTSNVTNMSDMFFGCCNLVELDVSAFDTSNVTNMSDMFYDCSKLEYLDLSNFITSNVKNMANLFHYCEKLRKLDISNLSINDDCVLSDEGLFEECKRLVTIYASKKADRALEKLPKNVNIIYK